MVYGLCEQFLFSDEQRFFMSWAFDELTFNDFAPDSCSWQIDIWLVDFWRIDVAPKISNIRSGLQIAESLCVGTQNAVVGIGRILDIA